MKKNLNFKIALYIRVSTEEQAVNPEGSLKSQEQRLREAVDWRNKNSNFGELVGVYVDAGISAKDMNRPRLQEMLRSIRRKEIDLVMVTEISRLSRNMKDFLGMWEMIHDHGGSVMSLREDFDTTTAAGEMLLFQIMNFAQFERKQTSERVTANMASRAGRGLYNGGPVPLGYKLIPDRQGYLAIDEEHAATIKVVFDTFLREGTLTSTAKWLNDNEFRAKKFMEGGGRRKRIGHFTIDNVHNILRNKAYAGIKAYLVKEETKEVPAVWEAIIDPVTFKRVGDLLSKNKSKLKPIMENSRHCYLLSGINYCKSCGDSMAGKTATGRASRVFYYEHGWATKRNAALSKKFFDCEPRRIQANKIELLVWEEVRKFLTNPNVLEGMRKEISAASHKNDGTKDRERIKAKISGFNSQLDALTEKLSLLPKNISPASFFKQMEKISLLKEEQEEKLLRINVDKPQSGQRFVKDETFEEFTEQWNQTLMKVSDETKKKIIHKLIRKIEVSKDGFVIHWLVDEEHYKAELALTANSFISGRTEKNFVVSGSQSLMNGAPDWSRTSDPFLRREVLYPTELRVRATFLPFEARFD